MQNKKQKTKKTNKTCIYKYAWELIPVMEILSFKKKKKKIK